MNLQQPHLAKRKREKRKEGITSDTFEMYSNQLSVISRFAFCTAQSF